MLLTKRPVQAAIGGAAFIRFVTAQFECYWLTTHCRGEAATAVRYLAGYYDADTIELLQSVKPTTWDTLKTEALDFTTDFFWLEDAPFESEKRVLERYGRLHRLILVELDRLNELPQLQQLLARVGRA
ncbi:hypothetical protein [Hymenobacter sp. CRA2]|uniref:hypothetical protein n=1 Tax=Hymenobacter sp. CRA2 TaxID=1955620 RepID=UPI00098F4043|nr:hypothetical protein [Hymenobacter sp. CRA2]OON71074.1 hypothetical protein B0919_03530 [Hymenobacter sp. CRA2]